MATFDPDAAPTPRNHLLAALPPEDLALLWPQLSPVELPFRQTLHMPEEPIRAVYFPETGYTSRLSPMEDGDFAEVGLVGPEGMTGLAPLLGADTDSFEMLVQVPGTAFRMDAGAFREALDRIPSFRPLLNRYALAHFEQVARTGACNGRHHTDQRLARWLLMAHDRVEREPFPMTHEFLSMMLGVRRAGITVAAGTLQKAGLIRYERGRMEITDRPGLEAASCECYGTARRAYDRLLGPPEAARRPYWG
ncbi:cyclic nucleotide-binding protein [Siccirubricoccus deserti]|nr:cyclic nucleotide-binding protein [Siccirubricoccus deserti]